MICMGVAAKFMGLTGRLGASYVGVALSVYFALLTFAFALLRITV